MDNKEKLVPKIRFKGFTDAWEQRKLGDLLTETKRHIRMEDDKEYQLVTVKRRNEGVISRGFFKGKDVLVKNYYKLQIGDYLISKRQIVHGANGLVPANLDGAIVSNEYLVSVGNQNISTNFLAIISKLPSMYRCFFLSSYGVDIEKLVFDVEDWKKRNILIPALAEQNMISLFLRTLDDTITLYQRKLEGLRALKKGYLEQMFPKAGEHLPRIRFAGFEGKWEERKLGEIAKIIGGGTPDTAKPDFWNGDINWYSPNEIGNEIYVFSSQRKITQEGLRRSSAKILPPNKTILFTSRASIGDMAILKSPAATNQGFQSLVVNDSYDVYFVYSLGRKIKEYALKNASGSTFLEISGKALSNMKLYVPSLKEQKGIGNFFYNLDNQITNYQVKLAKLQQLKTAYLQRMFI